MYKKILKIPREKYNFYSDLGSIVWQSDTDDCSNSLKFIKLYYVKFIKQLNL